MGINRGISVLSIALIITLGLASCRPVPSPSPSGEIEAVEYLGRKLTPISQQYNNAIAGVQNIDRETYRLTVDGAAANPLSLSYADLLRFPQESRLTELNCVEGWKFTAKWTGPQLNSLFAAAGVKPEAVIVIFHTTDSDRGFTSLDLSYIKDKILLSP